MRSFLVAGFSLCTAVSCLLASSVVGAAEEPLPRSQQPAVRAYWYDQGAEITSYDLVQSRYGEQRQGDAVLIYVTEPVDTAMQVKSDNPRAATAIPGFKLNATRNFLTGVYPYQTFHTILQPLDGAVIPRAIKQSTSIQEWCGHVFEQFNHRADGWHYRLFSYFQQAGDQDATLPMSWLEDELWTRIRLDPEQLPTGTFSMIPGALYRRFQHRPTTAIQAEAHWHHHDEQSIYHLRYPSIDRELRLTIETAFPYRLLSWQERSGKQTTSATRRQSIHLAYWQFNRGQDQQLRAKLGLSTTK